MLVPLVTLTAPDGEMEPPVPAEAVRGEEVTPLCVIVKVFPAIVDAAVLDAPVFAVTLYDTVPLPVPLAPEVMVAQETPVAADQVHPLCVVTVTLPVPPDAPMDTLAGEIV